MTGKFQVNILMTTMIILLFILIIPSVYAEINSKGSVNEVKLSVGTAQTPLHYSSGCCHHHNSPEKAGSCSRCNGSGKCQVCGGTGKINDHECSICNGSGKCHYCDGDGELWD